MLDHETETQNYRSVVAAIAKRLESGESWYGDALFAVHAATVDHAKAVGAIRAHYDEAHALADTFVDLAPVQLSLTVALGLPDERPETRQAELLAEGWMYERTVLRESAGALWDARVLYLASALSHSGKVPTVELWVPHRRIFRTS
jgi:hypothetical protein